MRGHLNCSIISIASLGSEPDVPASRSLLAITLYQQTFSSQLRKTVSKMADQGSNVNPSPSSSFQGRLNMETFRFKTADPRPASEPSVRRSTRLSSTISTAFKPTKRKSDGSTPASGLKKRKADTLVESPRAAGNKIPALSGSSSQTDAPEPLISSPPAPLPDRKKRNRPKSGYVPPAVYAHLPHLPDALAPNLLALFCGLNPGVRTAQTGHAYNHPSNRFWKLMYSSGVLPVPCTAEEDRTLPARFNLGLTNIVARPSRNGAELSKAEMDQGVSILEDKVRKWRPQVVCMVGKSIWESVWRVRHGGKGIGKDEFKYGWQDEGENMGIGDVAEEDKIQGVVYAEGWAGARVFVASSTSGLAATLRPEEKEKIWRELGVWAEQQRAEGAVAAKG